MQKKKLAGGALEVTDMCLGSMTWGTQNTEAEGHAQIDMALDHGINFIDTAEMYPVNPVSAETVGRTEEIIGSWFEKTGRRGDVILATKVTGDSPSVRGGAGFSGRIIPQTIEASLNRLKTDVIDIYQLHWPMRGSYHFRKNWGFDPSAQNREETVAHMRDVLAAMGDAVKAGKVRYFGLSNESAWGTAMWLRLAEEMGAPRVITMQNEYSLLCRHYDTDMAELSVNEDVGLMAYSPLGAGFLSGKYQNGAIPAGSRMTLNAEMGGRKTPRVFGAVEAYLDVARKHGLDPVQMALSFCRSRPFMGSVIFGATSLEQLSVALGAGTLDLTDEVKADIEAAHKAHPLPF